MHELSGSLARSLLQPLPAHFFKGLLWAMSALLALRLGSAFVGVGTCAHKLCYANTFEHGIC